MNNNQTFFLMNGSQVFLNDNVWKNLINDYDYTSNYFFLKYTYGNKTKIKRRLLYNVDLFFFNQVQVGNAAKGKQYKHLLFEYFITYKSTNQ